MALSKLEQEVVDTLQAFGSMTGAQLCTELRWGTAKLYPLLASLKDKSIVAERTAAEYPNTTTFFLRR